MVHTRSKQSPTILIRWSLMACSVIILSAHVCTVPSHISQLEVIPSGGIGGFERLNQAGVDELPPDGRHTACELARRYGNALI